MIPLRLVLDTNVVVSAALKPAGLQRTVLSLALAKPARLYLSAPIFEEYQTVLSRPEFRIRKGLRRQLLQFIKTKAYWVTPARHLRVAGDPDDDMFVQCADAARADYLITGNIRHFPRYWKGTKVITSREFLNLAAPHILG
jgi:uncharacterized protein